MAEDDRLSLPDIPDVRDHMEQLIRSMLGRGASQEGVWHPPVTVYDRPDSLLVEVDLPGMRGRNVSVSVEENHLYIEGTRQMPEEPDQGRLYYTDRPLGDFHRVIHLPRNIEAEGTEAAYDDGVLRVTLPKSEQARGRRIEIK